MTLPDLDVLCLRVASGVELFRQLGREDLALLLRSATKSVFKLGEVVYEQSSEGHSMYVVIQGQFEVYREHQGRRVRLGMIGPGEHFGEIALIANRTRSASVCALTGGLALRLTKEAVFGHPQIAAHLLRNMARMLAVRLTDADDEIILHRSKAQQAAELTEAPAEEVPLARNGTWGPRRGPVRRFAG
jgi:CRP/FNR family transcriptional regulator